MITLLEQIAEYRRKIDDIDENLLLLLKERFDLAHEIGRIKAQNNTEVKDDQREIDLIKRIEKFCDAHKMSKESIISIWRQILSYSYSVQTDAKTDV